MMDELPSANPAAETPTPTSPAPETGAPSLIGGTPPAEGTTETPPPAEWAEYVPDSTKSEDENAAAKAEHDKTKPGAEEKPAAPEPVAPTDITLPEGFEVDEATMAPFVELINDASLSRKDLAQKLVDLQIQSFKTADDARSKAWGDMVTSWQDAVRNDPTVGGAKFTSSVAAGNKVVQQFGDAELANLCATTGIGNHVSFVKFLNKIAERTLEPGVPSGAPAAQAPKSQADIMYPNQGRK
jgi:hypothetical protein